MDKKRLIRILAIIALVGAVGSAVTITLYFFNMFNENSALFGTLAVVFICFTVIFYIPTYLLKRKDRTEESYLPSDDEGGDGGEEGSSSNESEENSSLISSAGSDDKTDESESDIKTDKNKIKQSEVENKGK